MRRRRGWWRWLFVLDLDNFFDFCKILRMKTGTKFFKGKSAANILLIIAIWIVLVIPISLMGLANPKSIFEKDTWKETPSVIYPLSLDGIYPTNEIEKDLSEKSIELWMQFSKFNPQAGHLSLNTYVWPSEDYAKGYSSATVVDIPIEVFFDEITSNSKRSFKPGDSIGAIPITLDATNPLLLNRSNEFYYPFDEYSVDFYASLKHGDRNTEKITKNANTFELFYEPQVPGFEFEVWRGATFDLEKDWSEEAAYAKDEVLAQRQNGEISTLIKISRSGSVVYTSVLIYTGMLLGSLGLLLTTIYVARGRRPSSMTALISAAASILGISQMRAAVPGDPRLGILLDLYMFFPSLIMCIISSVVLAITWVRRDDFGI